MSKFIINLTIGKYNRDAMSLSVMANNQEIYNNPTPAENHIILEFDCSLPAQINFIVGNKQPFETKIDKDNNIIEDKHIKVDRVVIDRMPVEQWILESRMVNFMGKKTNYFYTNGVGSITIPNTDSFGFFLDLMTKIDQ